MRSGPALALYLNAEESIACDRAVVRKERGAPLPPAPALVLPTAAAGSSSARLQAVEQLDEIWTTVATTCALIAGVSTAEQLGSGLYLVESTRSDVEVLREQHEAFDADELQVIEQLEAYALAWCDDLEEQVYLIAALNKARVLANETRKWVLTVSAAGVVIFYSAPEGPPDGEDLRDEGTTTVIRVH